MTDTLIILETAKLAKEKGFNWDCTEHYGSSGGTFMDDLKNSELEPFECSAPTQSQLQKWLREEFNIHVQIYRNKDGFTQYSWNFDNPYRRDVSWYESYEVALEIGLREGLKKIII